MERVFLDVCEKPGSDEKFQQKKSILGKVGRWKHGKHGDFMVSIMVSDFMVSNKQNQPKWYFSYGGYFSRERSFRTYFLP